jgi:hypothetical protein
MYNTCSNFYAEGSESFKPSAYCPTEPRSPLTRKFSRNSEVSPQSMLDRGRRLQTKHCDPTQKRTYAVHDGCYEYRLHSRTHTGSDIGYNQGLTLTLISVIMRDPHWLWYQLHSGTHTDSDIGYNEGLTLTLISVTQGLTLTHWLIDSNGPFKRST